MTKIAFASNRTGTYQIFTINPDGTAELQLTNDSSNDVEPNVSRDGSTIAFASDRSGHYQLYTMDILGTNVKQLTIDSANHQWPVFSPDGKKLAYASDATSQYQIYVMDLTNPSSPPIQVTGLSSPDTLGLGGNNIQPKWALGGGALVFTAQNTGISRIYQIPVFISGAAAGPNTALTNSYSQDPDVSSETNFSNQFLGYSFEGSNFNVLRQQLSGGIPLPLTNNTADNRWPSWDPTDNFVVYATAPSSAGNHQLLIDQFALNTQSSLATTASQNHDNIEPSWSLCEPYTTSLPHIKSASSNQSCNSDGNGGKNSLAITSQGELVQFTVTEAFTGVNVTYTVKARGLTGINSIVACCSAVPNVMTAWIVGNAKTILFWNGSTVHQVPDSSLPTTLPPKVNLNGLDVNCPDEVWAVGNNGVILHRSGPGSPDSGWVTNRNPQANIGGGDLSNQQHLQAIKILSSVSGLLAVGDNGTILFSQDNGAHWSLISSGTTVKLNAIFDDGAGSVWIVGDKGTLLHFDPTTTLVTPVLNLGTTQNLNSISGTAPNDITAVGDNGTVLHWNSTQWTVFNSGFSTDFGTEICFDDLGFCVYICSCGSVMVNTCLQTLPPNPFRGTPVATSTPVYGSFTHTPVALTFSETPTYAGTLTLSPTPTPAYFSYTRTPDLLEFTETPTYPAGTLTPTPTPAYFSYTRTPDLLAFTETPTYPAGTLTPTPTPAYFSYTRTPDLLAFTETPTYPAGTLTPTPTPAYSSFTPTPPVPGHFARAMACTKCGKDDSVWIVGDQGMVTHTVEGSGSLVTQPYDLGTTQDLNSVVAFTNGTVWIAGNGGTVYELIQENLADCFVFNRFNKAGNLPSTLNIQDIHVKAASNTVWVTGYDTSAPTVGQLWVTNNPGAVSPTWTQINVPSNGKINNINGVGSNFLIVAGDNGTLEQSSDGGVTWTNLIPGLPSPNSSCAPSWSAVNFTGIFVLSSNDYWVVGSRGTILHFVSGTWTLYNPGTCNGDSCSDLKAVFADTNGQVLVGGAGTLSQYDASSGGFVPVCFPPNVFVLAICENHYCVKDSFTPISLIMPTPTPTFTVSPTDTASFTLTETPTVTQTSTATRTWSETTTLTASPTGTRTNTQTATLTATPSYSNTATLTQSRTATPTETVTQTYSATRTMTSSATITPTRTATPSVSASPTVTLTKTVTMTGTPTFTRSATSSATSTVTNTPSFTGTSTLTATLTPTETRTATPTASAVPTGTDTQTKTGTPTLTRSTTVTATPTNSASPTPTPTPTNICGAVPCATTLTWMNLAPLPTPMGDNSVVAVNGLLYSIGGETAVGTFHDEMSYFDPCHQKWVSAPSMSKPRDEMGVAAIGNIIYAAGGNNSVALNVLNTLEAYDTSSGGAWITKAPMPVGKDWPGAASLGGLFYVVGGKDSTNLPTNTMEVYSPSSDSWSFLPPMPTARWGLSLVADTVHGLLYAIGGRNAWGVDLNTVEVYNPAGGGSWSTASSLQTKRLLFAATFANGSIYVAGGLGTTGTLNTVETYDTTCPGAEAGAGAWSFAPSLNQAVQETGGAYLGGAFYVVGGFDVVGGVDVLENTFQQGILPCASACASSSIPGLVSRFQVIAGNNPAMNPLVVDSGQPFSVNVTALNSLGNVVKSYAGTVHFSIVPLAGTTANLPPNSKFSPATDHGTKVFVDQSAIFTSGAFNIVVNDVDKPAIQGLSNLILVNTPTSTITATATPTVTPTVSRTVTATRTITVTGTIIPTRTATTTATPSRTITLTPTVTLTKTDTRTVTATRTVTLTSTTTATPTATPSAVALACLPINPCPTCNGLVCETWDEYGPTPTAMPTIWAQQSGSSYVIQQNTVFGSMALQIQPTPGLGGAVAYNGPGAVLVNTDVEADMQVILTAGNQQPTAATLMARVMLDSNGQPGSYGYSFNVVPNLAGGVWFSQRSGSNGSGIGSTTTFNIAPGCTTFRMRFVVANGLMQGYVNDTLMLTAADPGTFSSGLAGMSTYSNPIGVDNIRINNIVCNPGLVSPTFTGTPTATLTCTPTPTAAVAACPIENDEPAALVLGQPDLVSGKTTPSISPSYLSQPGEMSVYGQNLFVSDFGTNRITEFNLPIVANDPDAIHVIGQPDFSAFLNPGGAISASRLSFAGQVYNDGSRLYVADAYSSRVVAFDLPITTDGPDATLVIGQPDFTSSSSNQGGQASAQTLSYPPGVYGDQHQLFISDGNNRVLVYNLPLSGNNPSADFVIGQADFSGVLSNQGLAGATEKTLNYPADLYSDGSRLYVVDSGNYRILVYALPIQANNPSAIQVLGQPNFTSNAAPIFATASNMGPWGVHGDGSRILVGDGQNNRVLVFKLPITAVAGASADFVLGQPDFTSNLINQGGSTSANSMGYSSTVYSDGSNAYVGDDYNTRVPIFQCLAFAPLQSALLAAPATGTTSSWGVSVQGLNSLYAFVGDTLNLTLTVSGRSDKSYNSTKVSLALPASMAYVSGTASSPVEFDSVTNSLQWKPGQWKKGDSREFKFQAQVVSPVDKRYLELGVTISDQAAGQLADRKAGILAMPKPRPGNIQKMAAAMMAARPAVESARTPEIKVPTNLYSRFVDEGKPVFAAPNPARETVTIAYYLKEESDVRLTLFGLDGKQVDQIALSRRPAGIGSTQVDLSHFGSGIYFVVLSADSGNGLQAKGRFKLAVLH